MRTLATLTAVLALLPATAAAQAPAPAPAEPGPPLLTVTGSGIVRAEPDTATIDIVVRRVGLTPEKPRTSANRRTRQIIAAVRRLGVARADIQTTGVALDRQQLRPRRRGGRVRVRYVARNQLTVRTTLLEAVGPIFDVATRAGATDFSGPRFTIVNRTPARADATSAAVADARRRADAAAGALGLRVTGVRSVSLDGAVQTTSDAGTLPESTSEGGGGSESPTPVEAGVEEIGARVTVVFVLGS